MSDNDGSVARDMSDTPHGRIAQVLHASGIRPGDRVPSESELSARLSMGRQQVREGLSVLDAFGVLAGRQGARRVWKGYNPGALVSAGAALGSADEDVVAALLEVRQALETSLLPSVAVRIPDHELAELRELAHRMVVLAEAGERFNELDAQFHRRLFACLGNSVLDGILLAFWVQFDAAAPDVSSAAADPDIARMHVRIVDALADGDQRRAVHELDAHFYGIRQRSAGGAPAASVTEVPSQEPAPSQTPAPSQLPAPSQKGTV